MIHLGVLEMPSAYVLKRWTWSAEENLVEVTAGQPSVMPEESRNKMTLAVMCNEFKGMANYGNQTDDGKKIIRMHLKAMKKDLATLKRETEKRAKRAAANTATTTSTSAANTTTQPVGPMPGLNTQSAESEPQPRPRKRAKKTTATTSEQTHHPDASNYNHQASSHQNSAPTMAASSETSQALDIRDPLLSNTKGRKKKHAFGSALNLGRKEIRVCKQCGSTEHDYRTCPQRGELPEQTLNNASTS